MKAQAQDDMFTRLPLWMWFVIGLIVAAIGIIWMLWEEENKQKRRRPATIPKPVGGATPPAPEPVEEAEVAARTKSVSTPTSTKPDDLRRIKGIGPKTRQVLNESGITTFEQLAATDVSVLEKIIKERGWRMANFDTWPEQARILAAVKKG